MSMITNVYYEPTLLGALGNTYPAGSYVRTLGFATIGDGGAAMYCVTGTTTSVITDKAITYSNYTLYCLNGRFHIGFDSENTIRPVFDIIPSNGKVYAEQFGALPDDDSLASTNVNLLGKAVDYVVSKGYTLTFASKGTYYLAPISITVQSNLFLDGNGATLHVIGGTDGGIGFFNSSSQVNNVTIKSVNLIGRNTYKDCPQQDQAFHIKATNFTLKDVNMKQFNFGIHSYGAYPENNKDYEIPEIVNKNWLLENCTISDTVTGLCLSEIDGITLKNCSITSDYTTSKKDHCIYLNSNCINVRVVDTNLGEITGDAFHKAFDPQGDKDNEKPIRRDISKNIFLNDVSIHNARSGLVFGIISENVMCDNTFATDVKIALCLSTTDNCIVSNSHIEQTKTSGSGTSAFVYVDDASKIWLQNSYVNHIGISHVVNDRVNNSDEVPKVYYRTLSENKKHRLSFLGQNSDIPNYSIKITGSVINYNPSEVEYYFQHVVLNHYSNPAKAHFSEYWDNCIYTVNTSSTVLRFLAINDLFGGITFRNCYMKNKQNPGQPPFWLQCNQPPASITCETTLCSLIPNKGCACIETGKTYPWLRFENNIYENFVYPIYSDWQAMLKSGVPSGVSIRPLGNDLVSIFNAYSISCYKKSSNSYSLLNLPNNN